MSNYLQQLQAQEQACPPGSQSFAQPSSSNPTRQDSVDDRDLNGHSTKAQKDGPSRQVGHFCRLPNGHMEWVPNPYLPRAAEHHADVDMTKPLPEGSTIHAANKSSLTSSSRRSMMANMFKKRMQTTLRNENRTLRKRNKEEAPRIYSDPTTQANSSPLPDYSTESTLASSVEQQWNNNDQMIPATDISSVLTTMSSNQRLVQQHIPIPLLHYQKRPYRVSRNTSEPIRQPRKVAVLPKMGKVLAELGDEA